MYRNDAIDKAKAAMLVHIHTDRLGYAIGLVDALATLGVLKFDDAASAAPPSQGLSQRDIAFALGEYVDADGTRYVTMVNLVNGMSNWQKLLPEHARSLAQRLVAHADGIEARKS